MSVSRRRACSVSHGKGRAEHPMWVRSCMVPTGSALPWNFGFIRMICGEAPLSQSRTRKVQHPPLLCTAPAALPASSPHSSSSSSGAASLDGGHSQCPQPLQPFSHISCLGHAPSTSQSWAQGLAHMDKATCGWSLSLGLWQGPASSEEWSQQL